MRTIRLLSFCGLFLLVAEPKAWAADWVNDWFAQSVTTSPGGLETQSRGYYTGGSFQGRWRMNNDYPLSVSPPRFKVGCGGIDLFGGGFSYLDAEYLVEKFERIIQAAPTFAFELAMQEYCKPCASAMQTLEQISDYLNSIQINDCRMAKQIATFAVKGDTSAFEDTQEKAMQGYALFSGQAKNTQDVDDSVRSSGGTSPIDTREMLSECPQVFKDVFTNGSVVSNVAGILSLSAYADLARGLIGDVQVSYNAPMQNFSIIPMEACPGNDQLDAFDLMTGRMEKKDATGTCSNAGSSKVVDAVESRLVAIATKMDAGGSALTPAEQAFLASAPFPLYNLMRDAVAARNVPETIGVIRDPLAAAYAFRMLDDIHKMTMLVLTKADEVQGTQMHAAATPEKCDTKFLKPAFSRIEAMDDLALRYRELAKASYMQQQSELLVNLQRAKEMLATRQQGLRDQGASLK